MTTLAVNKPRIYEVGTRNAFPVIASDILYEGAAIGIVPASGHARPLAAGDAFVGFAEKKADNSAGVAAAIKVQLIESGKIRLPITGLVITDVGSPVYASDDDTFSLSPVSGVFVGIVHRFEAAGYGIVHFDAPVLVDPYGGFVHALKSANYTITAADTGKWLWIDTDAVVITLPAVEGIGGFRLGNLGAFGTVEFQIAPNASDMIEGPGITAADAKKIINTKATARRGDYVEVAYGDANGWSLTRMRGTFAREA